MRFRCGEIFNESFITRLLMSYESDIERILKIRQHLPKLWAIKYRVVFFMKHGVCYNINVYLYTFHM